MLFLGSQSEYQPRDPHLRPGPFYPPLRGNTPSMPAMSLSTRFPPLEAGLAAARHSMDSSYLATDPPAIPHPLRIIKLRHSASRKSHLSIRKPKGSKVFFPAITPPATTPRSTSSGALLPKNGDLNTTTVKVKKKRRKPSATPKSSKSSSKNIGGSALAWLQRPNTGKPRRDSAEMTKDPTDDPSLLSTTVTGDKMSSGSSRSATFGSAYGTHAIRSERIPPATPLVDAQLVKKSELLRRATTAGYATLIKEQTEEIVRNFSAPVEKGGPESDGKDHSKGWAKRVFSGGFFSHVASGGGKLDQEDKTKGSSEPVATVRPSSPAQTIVRRHTTSEKSSIQNIRAQSAFHGNPWQPDSIGIPVLFPELNIGGGGMNDSVVGVFEGKFGGLHKLRKPVGQWRPPNLSLSLNVVSEVDKAPVSFVDHDASHRQFWVSVEITGKVDDGDERLGDDVYRVGLDVGVLLDISAYTSPDTFVEMKEQAKAIVESMDTSRDRIAVMTFSAPPPGKRVPSSSGRANMKVLNSSGSVAKRKLLENIAALEPSLDGDLTGRDVSAAVLAGAKMLGSMPMDTLKYGGKRHPHLFLITAELNDGDIHLIPEALYGSVKVHVIGLGAVFCPTSSMGGNGWCISTHSLEPANGLQRVVIDDVDIAVDNTESAKRVSKVPEIIRNLRMGVNLGEIRDVNVLLKPRDDCLIKTVIGDTSFDKLLPGERRTLLIRLEMQDLQKEETSLPDLSPAGSGDWGVLARELEATLGELKSDVLLISIVYRHSEFPGTTLTTEKIVDVMRYSKDSVWAAHSDQTEFFADTWRGIHAEYVRKALVQKLASSHVSPKRAKKAVEQVATIRATRMTDMMEVQRELLHKIQLEEMCSYTINSRASSKKRRAGLNAVFYGTIPTKTLENEFSPILPLSPSRTVSTKSTIIDENLISFTPPSLLDRNSIQDLSDTETLKPKFCRRSKIRPTSDSVSSRYVTPSRPISLNGPPEAPDEAKKLWRDLRRERAGKSGIYGSIKSNRRNAIAAAVSSAIEGEMELESELDFAKTNPTCTTRSKRSMSDNETGDSTVTLRDVHETDFSPWAL